MSAIHHDFDWLDFGCYYRIQILSLNRRNITVIQWYKN